MLEARGQEPSAELQKVISKMMELVEGAQANQITIDFNLQPTIPQSHTEGSQATVTTTAQATVTTNAQSSSYNHCTSDGECRWEP